MTSKVSKKEVLGQYFTNINVVRDLINFLNSYRKYDIKSKVLEPSFGTGNFIKKRKKRVEKVRVRKWECSF